MKFTSIFSSLALLGAAVATPTPEDYDAAMEEHVALLRRQIPSKTCSHQTGGIHVIAAGGANTDNPRDYGYLSSLAQNILREIPGSTNVSLPYDKVLQSQKPPKLRPNAVPNGMRLLKQYVVDYHHFCPGTKIALIGYSSGAVIMMNDLCYGGNGQGTPQMNPLIAGNVVIAATAYGEETFVPGQEYNRGSCTSGKGVAPRANPGLCHAGKYAPYIRSFCDAGDPDCCVGQGEQDVQVHFGYPKKYDQTATNFIKRRLAAAGGA